MYLFFIVEERGFLLLLNHQYLLLRFIIRKEYNIERPDSCDISVFIFLETYTWNEVLCVL